LIGVFVMWNKEEDCPARAKAQLSRSRGLYRSADADGDKIRSASRLW
jgi:hypothetical protein